MKICLCCKQSKELEEFHKYNRSKDGRRATCKPCRAKKEPTRTEYNSKYYARNTASIKKSTKEWQKKNPEKVKIYAKRTRESPKGVETRLKYQKENKVRFGIVRREYAKARKKVDPGFKLLCNLRRRLNKALKGKRKGKKTLALLGCSPDELRKHLESQFKENMNWENYGPKGWHIDHILPLSSFDLTNPEELKKANHFSNLQPLWAKDNHLKGARILA